jgi:hypothetical protein
VMVPQAGAEAAQEVLLDTDMASPSPAALAPRPRALRLAAAIAAGGLLAALIAWVLQQVAA